MINKITNRTDIPLQTKKLNRKEKKSTIENKGDQGSLVDNIVKTLSTENISSDERLRQRLIIETLTQVLGEKSSSEPAFKLLIEKIEHTLKNNPLVESQIKELRKQIN